MSEKTYKLQLPITTNATPPTALAYNRTRKEEYHIEIDKRLLRIFGKALKIFVEGEIVSKSTSRNCFKIVGKTTYDGETMEFNGISAKVGTMEQADDLGYLNIIQIVLREDW